MKKIAVILASLLVAACASTHKAETSQAPQSNGTNATAASPAANSAMEAEVSASKLKAEIDALQKQSVYFDFDKYLVKPEFQATIQKQAEFLKSHGNDVVTLQGNCDERGSAEYNLALGSERAQAVEKDLEVLGVPASQMKVVSFGEEKPRLTCHAEKCWKENRRVDFVHDLK
jgi:peptidoglycan-associated lipoprotein